MTENLPQTQLFGKDALVDAPPKDENAMSVGNMWASMLDLAKDPTIDAQKIGHLVGLQEKMIDRAAKDAFNRAFAMACREMPEITKDDKIEHNGKFIGWFKKYEDLRRVVDGVINPLGLSITHDSSEIDGGRGGILVWTVITYMDDQFTWVEERAKMPVPPDAGGAKGAAQAIGSSMTYGERYSLAGAFGIVQRGLDKDGKTPENQILTDRDASLVNAAMAMAEKGTDIYIAYYGGLERSQRITLTQKKTPHPNGSGDVVAHELAKQIAKSKD